jgi:cation:H+ antiporter
MNLETALILVLGLALLIGGAEFLVRGASRIAVAFGISPLVVGLTVVAFGTSSPEFAVSVMASFKGEADLAMGNVVGSNIFNVLVILGLAAVIVPLTVAQQLIRFDVPVMIGVSIVTLLLGLDGSIGHLDGMLLFAGAVSYTVFLIRQSRREGNPEVKEEYEVHVNRAAGRRKLLTDIGMVILGLVALVWGSKFLVTGAVTIAKSFGIPELVIGLTIVSAGTSLPEVAASITAALKGERDIAVGNVVGSNIFNLMSVLGLGALVSPHGIPVSAAALRFDLPVMVAIAVACLPIFLFGRISRMNGMFFLAYYAMYLVYLFFMATHHPAFALYQKVLGYGVLPITVLVLLAMGVKALEARKLGRITA